MPVCNGNASAPDASAALEEAVAVLRCGGAVVYPTETFYGLGVDATNSRALERLVALKGRPRGKPISVLVANREMLGQIAAEVSDLAGALIDRFWPGPLTLVLPARPDLSEYLTGGTATVGVRWSSHALATALVAALGHPITTPSANPNGAAPPVTVAQARAYFADSVGAYLDGGTLPGGLGSTVVEAGVALRIVRPGVIPTADVLALEKEEC